MSESTPPRKPPYPECHHIMPSGSKCHSPALRGKPLCYYHSRQRTLVDHNRYRQRSVALPPMEDRSAIQLAVNEVLAAMSDSKISRHEAGLYLFGIQIASQNLTKISELSSPDPISLFREETGDVLAIEESPSPSAQPDASDPIIASGSDLHLDHCNTCDTHEYDPEPPNPQPQTRKQQQILNDLETRTRLTIIADQFRAEERAKTEARRNAEAVQASSAAAQAAHFQPAETLHDRIKPVPVSQE